MYPTTTGASASMSGILGQYAEKRATPIEAQTDGMAALSELEQRCAALAEGLDSLEHRLSRVLRSNPPATSGVGPSPGVPSGNWSHVTERLTHLINAVTSMDERVQSIVKRIDV